MTTLTAVPARTAEESLRTVLRVDAAVTGAVGLLALFAPTAWFDAGWLPRAVGVVLLIVAIEVALFARSDGRRLRLTGTVTGELAAAWVVASIAVLALVELPTTGALVIEGVAAVTAVFAVLELRLVRRLRD